MGLRGRKTFTFVAYVFSTPQEMKPAILFLALLALIACNEAPKQPATTTAIDSSLGVASWKGPGVDLLKKATEAYAKGDWATWRSCFADTARASHNVDPFDPSLSVSIDTILARHKYSREVLWDSLNISGPLYEIVTAPDGAMYGHLWVMLHGLQRKTGKAFKMPVFASYGIKDGRLQYEAAVYDNSLLLK